jgi:hypothetical protein
MSARTATGLAALALLGACGSKQALQPPAGESRVPIPRGATERPTPQQLVTPPPQTRPERNVEPLTKSEERTDDPFDTPPEAR